MQEVRSFSNKLFSFFDACLIACLNRRNLLPKFSLISLCLQGGKDERGLWSLFYKGIDPTYVSSTPPKDITS